MIIAGLEGAESYVTDKCCEICHSLLLCTQPQQFPVWHRICLWWCIYSNVHLHIPLNVLFFFFFCRNTGDRNRDVKKKPTKHDVSWSMFSVHCVVADPRFHASVFPVAPQNPLCVWYDYGLILSRKSPWELGFRSRKDFSRCLNKDDLADSLSAWFCLLFPF